MNLENIKYVVDNSDYVKINKTKLDEFIKDLGEVNYNHWYKSLKLDLSEKERIIMVFLIESLNFCFWKKPKWKIEYEERAVHGSEALFFSIIKEIKKDKSFLDVSKLSKTTKEEFIKIFSSIEGEIPLINERYDLFLDTIKVIDSKKEMFFEELFSVKNDVELLDYIASNFKYFQDFSNYKERKIEFNKRAILLTNDLYYISDTINSNIKNANSLFGCADYGIPKTLRHYGILEYNKELAAMVDNEIEIEHNSCMEIEIRANMVYVLELIKIELAKKNIIVNSVELDNLVWSMGKKNKSNVPYHHTVTIAY